MLLFMVKQNLQTLNVGYVNHNEEALRIIKIQIS